MIVLYFGIYGKLKFDQSNVIIGEYVFYGIDLLYKQFVLWLCIEVYDWFYYCLVVLVVVKEDYFFCIG